MRRFEIEKLYEFNGLTHYKLRNTGNLLNCHGVDFKAVAGYNKLDDLNRAIYEKFIINIFNAGSLDSRAILAPKAIYFVEETQYRVKENSKDDYYVVSGGAVMVIDRSELKSVVHTWEDEDYKHLEVKKSEA